jgi:hypothetical protein
VQTFANVDAKVIKLWKVEIPDDHVDPLCNLSLQDQDELLATKKISKYFPDSLAEECIHVTFETEQELLDELASLRELFNKSVHGT